MESRGTATISLRSQMMVENSTRNGTRRSTMRCFNCHTSVQLDVSYCVKNRDLLAVILGLSYLEDRCLTHSIRVRDVQYGSSYVSYGDGISCLYYQGVALTK